MMLGKKSSYSIITCISMFWLLIGLVIGIFIGDHVSNSGRFDAYNKVDSWLEQQVEVKNELKNAKDLSNAVLVNMGVVKEQQDYILSDIGRYISDWNKLNAD